MAVIITTNISHIFILRVMDGHGIHVSYYILFTVASEDFCWKDAKIIHGKEWCKFFMLPAITSSAWMAVYIDINIYIYI